MAYLGSIIVLILKQLVSVGRAEESNAYKFYNVNSIYRNILYFAKMVSNLYLGWYYLFADENRPKYCIKVCDTGVLLEGID